MEDDECIHGLGPVSACVICNGRAKTEQAAAEHAPKVFEADRNGWCPGCRKPICAGDMLAWLPDHKATHEGCWPW